MIQNIISASTRMNNLVRFSIFLVLTLLLVACSKDSIDPHGIVGEWELTAMYTDQGGRTVVFYGAVSNGSFGFYADSIDLTTVFSDNPNNFATTGSYRKVTLLVHPITGISSMEIIHDTINESGSWVLEDTILKLQLDSSDRLIRILELTDKNLRLKLDYLVTSCDIPFFFCTTDRATVISSYDK